MMVIIFLGTAVFGYDQCIKALEQINTSLREINGTPGNTGLLAKYLGRFNIPRQNEIKINLLRALTHDNDGLEATVNDTKGMTTFLKAATKGFGAMNDVLQKLNQQLPPHKTVTSIQPRIDLSKDELTMAEIDKRLEANMGNLQRIAKSKDANRKWLDIFGNLSKNMNVKKLMWEIICLFDTMDGDIHNFSNKAEKALIVTKWDCLVEIATANGADQEWFDIFDKLMKETEFQNLLRTIAGAKNSRPILVLSELRDENATPRSRQSCSQQ